MDNIFGDRFVGERPAWHTKGRGDAVSETAVQAFSSATPYDVYTKELFYFSDESGGSMTRIPEKILLRSEVPDDPIIRSFGIVGKEYTVVPPLRICEIWDEVVKRPIETFGALGKGETIWLSTKLPDMDVKGSEVNNYLLLVSPYGTGQAFEVRNTPVLVVCQNTLQAARASSTELYKIVHDYTAEARLASWLDGIYDRAVYRTQLLKEFFELFTTYKVREPDQSIQMIYPDPKPLRRTAPDDVMEIRQGYFEQNLAFAKRQRSMVRQLFDGAGVGMDVEICKGTGWGLYQAVCEWEDWRKAKNDDTRTEAVLFGERAEAKERAFAVVRDLATGE